MNYFFVGLQIACTAYAFLAGGGPERIGATVYALAVGATHVLLVTHSGRWQDVEIGVFVVDVLLFISFTILALRAHRFWPIWVSSLLGLGVLGHLARWLGPDVIPWAYWAILTIWSYPILAIIAIGTWNHQRRLTRHGVDPSWSSSLRRSGTGRRAGPTA